MPKRKPAHAPAPVETRAVGARGQEYTAEKLTGNRAQKGNLPGGAPCWIYEVKWEGTRWKNTYEPAACLVGWEAQMKKIDEKYSVAALLPKESGPTFLGDLEVVPIKGKKRALYRFIIRYPG